MSERDLSIFLKILKKEKRAASKYTKAKAGEFLKTVGVLTKNGNLTKPFKEICIPKGHR